MRPCAASLQVNGSTFIVQAFAGHLTGVMLMLQISTWNLGLNIVCCAPAPAWRISTQTQIKLPGSAAETESRMLSGFQGLLRPGCAVVRLQRGSGNIDRSSTRTAGKQICCMCSSTAKARVSNLLWLLKLLRPAGPHSNISIFV